MKRQVKQQRRRLKKENAKLTATVENLQAKLTVERTINEKLRQHPEIRYFKTQTRLDRRSLGLFNLDDLIRMLQEKIAANVAKVIVEQSLIRYDATLDRNLDVVVSAMVGTADLHDASQLTIQDALRTIPDIDRIREYLQAYQKES